MQAAAPARSTAQPSPATPWLWTLVALYAAARLTQAFPDRIPIVWIVALHVLLPLAFAMLHGGMLYGIRVMLVFVLLCVSIGGGAEQLSLHTGFPFGHYHFSEVMGPKFLHVPVFLALAYVGVGYLAWTTAGIILRDTPVLTRPLLAAGVMTAWDLSMEPVWANLVHAWVWENGGAYFGVPVSNFLGWYLTNFLIYQSFALLVRPRTVSTSVLPRGFWASVVACYGMVAAGNLCVIAPHGLDVIRDASGATWRVGTMLVASAIVSIGVMGGITALAGWRLLRRNAGLLWRQPVTPIN